MVFSFPPRRVLLLAAAVLTCGGAAGLPNAEGTLARPGPSGSFGAYLVGRFAASESDTRIAADNLLSALRADPNVQEVLTRAFTATVMDGRPDALRLARRLPDNQIAALVLTGSDAVAGRWERAEQRVRALPRQGPAQILQPLMLAWMQQGRGQTDLAIATLRPLTEGGRLRGLHALHAALIADIAGRHRDAERYVRIALAESPEPTLRLITLSAGILARAGREAEAVRLMDQLGRSRDDLALSSLDASRRAILSGRSVASPVEGLAEAQLALAASLRGQGAAEYGLLLTRLALRLRPGFAPALLLAADALMDERQEEAALAVLMQVEAGDPLAPVAAMRRAIALDRLDRVEEAIAELQRLWASHPRSSQPAGRLGDILRGRSRWAEAAAAYDEAVARLGAPVAADWSLFYSRGIALERDGRWPQAEADFRRALELSPEQPYVLNYLAYTWVEMGQNLAEARAMLERAVALRPNDGNIVDSLGWALFKLGDIEGAIRWLEQAVELEPRSSVINDHLGDAYWRAGRQREAEFQWRRALSLDPEPGEAPRIEQKLREGLPPPPAAEARR
ncbi:MAG TPA: tetratricopeptide repeat protein [Acetobacteraceae bacterium]|nr:tetratricopeptide repeat protein [Acetobacteraceae bacterium]